MTDLRELLGDKYDETIETTARALDAAWNPERYPVLAAMFRDYAQTALAAVLPELLADVWDDAQPVPARTHHQREASQLMNDRSHSCRQYQEGVTQHGRPGTRSTR